MRLRVIACLLAGALVASAAGVVAQNQRQAAGAPAAGSSVTFSETIAPIVYANCVTCHRAGEAAPFPLVTYEDVAKRGALIARVTESRYMPPWHAAEGYGEFVGERRLTSEQIAVIGAWVKQGMPRGDEAKLPRLPAFPADGWRLGPPDLVLEMPAGFDVPAGGPDVFRNFVIPTRLTEDKWVRGVEFRPSARKVVHHAIFAQVTGGSLAAIDGADGRPGFGGMGTVGVVNTQQDQRGLGGWAVGATPMFFPEGLASRLAAGSDFLLQLHFHPSGKPETERSLIGLYFTDTPPTKKIVSIDLPSLFSFGWGIDIAPGVKDYTIKDSFTLPGDVRLYVASAHAHYLAREMKAIATLPDGSTRPLLWIDDWDFNWQDSYVYKTPIALPKGTRIDTTITYDNSVDNPRNPINPPRRAMWGEQSFDEMGGIGFAAEVVNAADVSPFEQALAERVKTTIAAAGKNGTLGRFLARNKRERGPRQQITVFDRSGAVVTRVGEPGLYAQAAFSPDATQVAVAKTDPDTGNQDIWTFDLASGRGRAITNDEAADSAPLWSPDGRSIAFASSRDNTYGIYRRAADGSGAEERLYQHDTGNALILTDWSADGRFMTFWYGQGSMFVLPVTGDRKPILLEQGRGARFSPDGRYLAYNAFEEGQAGRFQMFVRPLAPPLAPLAASAVRQVSTALAVGGIAWRRDGKEVYFLSQPPGQSMMVAEVTGSGSFATGTPKQLFALPPGIGAPAQLSSVSSADGQRFVFAVNLPQRTAAPAATPAPPAAAR
jgi:dipeptidyl aminopeptidase/acylaminoacyl peptidase/mono/diheme cytochrome c family protein